MKSIGFQTMLALRTQLLLLLSIGSLGMGTKFFINAFYPALSLSLFHLWKEVEFKHLWQNSRKRDIKSPMAIPAKARVKNTLTLFSEKADLCSVPTRSKYTSQKPRSLGGLMQIMIPMIPTSRPQKAIMEKAGFFYLWHRYTHKFIDFFPPCHCCRLSWVNQLLVGSTTHARVPQLLPLLPPVLPDKLTTSRIC